MNDDIQDSSIKRWIEEWTQAIWRSRLAKETGIVPEDIFMPFEVSFEDVGLDDHEISKDFDLKLEWKDD